MLMAQKLRSNAQTPPLLSNGMTSLTTHLCLYLFNISQIVYIHFVKLDVQNSSARTGDCLDKQLCPLFVVERLQLKQSGDYLLTLETAPTN